MSINSTPKKSRAKRSQTTALGKSIVQKSRQKLAREQAEVEERMAQDVIRRASRKPKAMTAKVISFNNAVNRSIVKRTAGVLISEGINVPVNSAPVAPSNVTAWTDFASITVRYPIHEDAPQLTAAIVRGLLYHEGGHIRFTVPFSDLADMYCDETNLDTIGTSSPAAVSTHSGVRIELLHRAWNCLEDQRMETAVVSDSPRKAAYFAPMVLSHLLSDPDSAAHNWPVLPWRRYLSPSLRRRSRKMFVSLQNDRGNDGAALADKIEQITDRYVLGTDATTLMEAVIELGPILWELNGHREETKVDKHQPWSRSESVPDFDIPIDPSMVEESEPGGEGEPQPGKGEDDKSGEAEASKDEQQDGSKADDDEGRDFDEDSDADYFDPDLEDEGNDDEDEGNDDEDETSSSDDASKDDSDDSSKASKPGSKGADDSEGELTQGDLDKALAEAEEHRAQDETLAEDVREFNRVRNDITSDLPVPSSSGELTDPDVVSGAFALADDMRRAFEAATVNVAPNWQEEQQRGIINPLRYVTRPAGNTTFWRSYADNGNPGFDIAVSILLDYSGSMSGYATELAQAAYACKRGCDDLDIPCTVVLWNDSAAMLWDASERAESVPSIQPTGGTNPQVALDDIDNHVHGQPKHIVLIMTDGEWGGRAPNLSSFREPGRTILGVTYYVTGSMAGADAVHQINNLNEIPRLLEQALIESV